MLLFILHSLLFPSRDGKMRALSSECNIDQTDSMPFLPSNLIEEVSPNPEVLAWNT